MYVTKDSLQQDGLTKADSTKFRVTFARKWTQIRSKNDDMFRLKGFKLHKEKINKNISHQHFRYIA